MGLPSGDESGFSLVEILISIAILGIAFASLLGGLGVTIFASDMHRQQADVGAVLASSTEALKDQSRNAWVPCAVPADYDPTDDVVLPVGTTWMNADVAVVSIEHGYWDGADFKLDSCSTARPMPLQRITVLATDPRGRADGSLTFLRGAP